MSFEDEIEQGSNSKLDYIKSIACIQAPCKDFNKIPVSRLTELYNYWLKRNEVVDNSIAAEKIMLELEAENQLEIIKKTFNL